MRKRKILSIILIIVLLSFNISFTNTTLVEDEIYINNPYKVFSFSLSEKIDKNTVNKSTAYISNIDFSITFEDDYTINLVPLEKYTENTVYSIILSNEIKSLAGENLKLFTQDFILNEDTIEVSTIFTNILDNTDIPDEPVDNTTDEPVDDTTDEPVDDTTDEPVDDTTDEPVDDTTDEPVDDTTDEPVDDTTDEPVDDTTDEPVDDTTDEPVDDTTDEPVDDTTDEPVDDTTDEPVDDTTDEPVDDTTDEPVDDTTDEPVDDTTDEPVDDTTDEPVDDTTDEPVDDTTDEPVDDTTDEPVDDTTDEPVDDTTDEPVDDTTDEPVDDTTDEPVDDTTDEPVDDTTDEPVDDTTDEPVDDTTDEPVDDTTDEPVDDTTDEPVDDTTDEEFVVENVSTLRKYSEMDKLEKIAHDILFGFTNLQEIIEWEIGITTEEINYIFKNYLANQKNQIRLKSLDNAEYIYELSDDGTEWLFYGLKKIEYHVTQDDMDQLNARYSNIRNSLDLENKTNREKSEIIAIKLVELFDYNSENVNGSNLQNQSYFSILYDKTVCSGYTNAYSHLLNLEGIRSDYIFGDYINNSGQSIAHVWNKVYLSEDEVVYTDVTHMDNEDVNDPSNYDAQFLNNTSKVFGQSEKRINLGTTVLFSTDITH